jgi:two-component system sensor histidine kinase PilS (NtrC family)
MLQIRLALGVAVFALGPLLFRAYAATLCLFTGALLLLTGLYTVLLRRRFHPKLFANVQIFADVFLVTVLIALTGWEDSKFTFLYIIPIITTSLFFQLRQSISIALLSSMLYAAVILFHRYRLSVPVREGGIETFYSLYIRTVIFCVVGYLCGHLANLLEKEKQELRELKNLHHLILSGMNSGVLTTDARDRIIYANRAAEEILRLPAAQLKRWSLSDLFLSDGDRPLEEIVNESLNGHGSMGKRKAEVCARTTEGRIVPIGFNIAALPNRLGKPVGKVMVFSDLTEVKELERRLRAIDKFRAAGELAAGIAHEIRNPLASITGSVEMLAESRELSETNRKLLSVLMSESTRLNGIIEDFLAYARRGNLDLKKEDLCQIMKEAVELVGRNGKLPPGVRIELVTPPEPAIASADRSCMSQVFLNLLNNAVEAVDGRGMIFVKIESPLVTNDRYAITVSDTGNGIPPDKLSRVFEPFFTTKKNGVGIGLCIAERIVREHNGHIDITSEVGKGTSVTVVIPVDQGSSGGESQGWSLAAPSLGERAFTAETAEAQGKASRRRRSADATVRL